MVTTRTGSFPVGFRRGGGWQKDLDAVIRFATDNNFAGIDIGQEDPASLKKITAAGLRIGTVDVKGMGDLASPDAGKRKAVAQENAEYAKQAAAFGIRNYFTCIVPPDPTKPRSENFKYAVDGYSQLCAELVKVKARIVLEGWPGMNPWVASIGCTPADYRAFLKEMPEGGAGVNFDPSHLIRMGVNPVPFLEEFASRVYHVHGKDTEIIPEAIQEHGYEQLATFEKEHRWGSIAWRYTIPGHGCARWTKLLSILADAGFDGMVCIELEDENFADTEPSTKQGLLGGRDFLIYA